MLEPDFLTVAELADRWSQTERQIIGHAQALRLPLYFAFDGLAFDAGDDWFQSTGVEFIDVQQQHDAICKSLEIWTRHLEKNSLVLKGRRKPSEYEPYPLSRDEVLECRTNIEAEQLKRDALADRLAQRKRERLRFGYRGHLRAAPKTIWDLGVKGRAVGVYLAFHPGYPVKLTTIEGRQVVDGRLMVLEPFVAGHGWHGVLTAADMLIVMTDIKTLEQPEPKTSASAHEAEVSTAQTTLENNQAVDKRDNNAPAWHLAPWGKGDSLAFEIHKALKCGIAGGRPSPPKAREVADMIKASGWSELIEITDDGIKYQDAKGNVKVTSFDAMARRIERMTTPPATGH